MSGLRNLHRSLRNVDLLTFSEYIVLLCLIVLFIVLEFNFFSPFIDPLRNLDPQIAIVISLGFAIIFGVCTIYGLIQATRAAVFSRRITKELSRHIDDFDEFMTLASKHFFPPNEHGQTFCMLISPALGGLGIEPLRRGIRVKPWPFTSECVVKSERFLEFFDTILKFKHPNCKRRLSFILCDKDALIGWYKIIISAIANDTIIRKKWLERRDYNEQEKIRQDITRHLWYCLDVMKDILIKLCYDDDMSIEGKQRCEIRLRPHVFQLLLRHDGIWNRKRNMAMYGFLHSDFHETLPKMLGEEYFTINHMKEMSKGYYSQMPYVLNDIKKMFKHIWGNEEESENCQRDKLNVYFEYIQTELMNFANITDHGSDFRQY